MSDDTINYCHCSEGLNKVEVTPIFKKKKKKKNAPARSN